MFADLQNKYIDLYFFFVVFQLNFYFAQYGLLQSMVCTMIDVQTKSIEADFGRKPDANTVLYFPFKEDILDKVGNASIPVSGTKGTIGYSFSSSGSIELTNSPNDCRFISVWFKFNSSLGNYSQTMYTKIGGILYNFQHTNSSFNKRFQYHSTSTGTTLQQYPVSNQINTNSGQWYHLAFGTDGTKVYAYLNGNKVRETTITPGLKTETSMILCQSMNCEISEFIGQKNLWNDQEIYEYFEETKSIYGY